MSISYIDSTEKLMDTMQMFTIAVAIFHVVVVI